MTKTKFEAMDILNEFDIPCGPILSMKELAEDKSLRETGTVVEVDHPKRGKYLSVGNPIKLSDEPDGGGALAAARRTYDRDPVRRAALQPRRDRRHQSLRRHRTAEESRRGVTVGGDGVPLPLTGRG